MCWWMAQPPVFSVIHIPTVVAGDNPRSLMDVSEIHKKMMQACREAGLMTPYLVIKECAGVAMEAVSEAKRHPDCTYLGYPSCPIEMEYREHRFNQKANTSTGGTPESHSEHGGVGEVDSVPPQHR